MSKLIAGAKEKFPPEILSNSDLIEGNVCACLLQNLTYYDDSSLEASNFLTEDGRFLYSIGRMMRDKSYVSCDEVSVITSLNGHENLQEKLESIGGWKNVQHLMDCVDVKNWDAYIDALNKRNILCQLTLTGYNLVNKITLKNGKSIEPYKLFEKYSSTEVLDFYENKISTLAISTNSNSVVEEGYIDFDDSFLEHLSSQQEIGVSIGDMGADSNGEIINTFKFLNNDILGLKQGTLSCLASHSGCGKTTSMACILFSLAAHGQKTVIVSNEAQLNDMKIYFLELTLTRCLDYWKLPKKKLISGKGFTDEDREYIKKAQDFWRSHYNKMIKMVVVSEMRSDLVCHIIKKNILAIGCSAFLVDTFKLNDSSDGDDSFWLQMLKDSRKLANIALQYKAIGLMTMQLALSTVNRCWIDSSCLANSRGCKEIFSNLIMMRKVADCELDPHSDYYIKPFRTKQKADGTWYDEPYEPDPTKVWRYIAIDKSRRGADTNDTGVGYLWRADLDFSSFYETAKCRSTRKILGNDFKSR